MIELAIALIVLHSVDGYEVSINPEMVTTLRASKDNAENKLLTDKVRCIIGTSDGKFVSVAETCEAVRKLLESSQ